MKRLLLVLCLVLSGCAHYGPEKREDAFVVSAHFRPDETHVVPGLDTKGNLTLHVETTPAEYYVVFRCQHGQFAVNDKKTWSRVHPGETWVVVYRERFLDEAMKNLDKLEFERVEPKNLESERKP